nr:hypothetical protein [Tanacetum cinerariifolium]
MNPSTIATITTISHAPIPPTTIPSEVLQNLPTFDSVFRFEDRLKSLEASFSEYKQTNPFAKAVSNILGIVYQYMNQQMTEAVRVAVQIQTNRLRDSYQRENDEFLRTIDENMKRIIKEQVKVAVNLSELELKKILIEKMEGNKSIQRSDEQRNLYKALVDAYEADKTILDSYGETVILKRRRDNDDDQDEGSSTGSDRGSKRRREVTTNQPRTNLLCHPISAKIGSADSLCQQYKIANKKKCYEFWWIDLEISSPWYKYQMFELYATQHPEEGYQFVEHLGAQDQLERLQIKHDGLVSKFEQSIKSCRFIKIMTACMVVVFIVMKM